MAFRVKYDIAKYSYSLIKIDQLAQAFNLGLDEMFLIKSPLQYCLDPLRHPDVHVKRPG